MTAIPARVGLGVIVALACVAAREGEGDASQISYRDITLAKARKKAKSLIEARYVGKDTKYGGALLFQVTKVLRGKRGRRDEAIRVFTAEAQAWAMVRKAYRSTGVRRSPLLDRLTKPPAGKLMKGKCYCLLLTDVSSSAAGKSDHQLVVADGHVPVACPQPDLHKENRR